jgi:hypothetical protein
VAHEVPEIVELDAGGHADFGRMVCSAWIAALDMSRLDLIGIESKVSPGFLFQDATAENE